MIHVWTMLVVLYILTVRQATVMKAPHGHAEIECGPRGGLAPSSWFTEVPYTVRYPEWVRENVGMHDNWVHLDIEDESQLGDTDMRRWAQD